MKKLTQLDQKLILTIGSAVILMLLAIKILNFSYTPEQDYYSGAFFPFESRLAHINNQLRLAQQKADSVKQVKEQYVDGELDFSGFVGDIGVGRLTDKKNKLKYDCVVFGNIGLKLNEEVSKSHLSFHTVGKQGYFTKMRFAETKYAANVSLIDQKVGFNYNLNENHVLIKINSNLTIVCYIVMIIIGIVQLIILRFILVNFFKFLFKISKNEAFTFENIIRLKMTSTLLFVLAFCRLIINSIIYVIFISIFSSEGVAFKYSFWEFDVYLLMLAILCYIIYTAFKRAMILQEEQELTI